MKRGKTTTWRDAALPGQLDLFSFAVTDLPSAPVTVPAKPIQSRAGAFTESTMSITPAVSVSPTTQRKPTPQAPPVGPAPKPPESSRNPDEWWTTKMVCGFLKISRKTLWERRRRASIGFPRPVNLGGGRNVYRASEVRAWADLMAFMQLSE